MLSCFHTLHYHALFYSVLESAEATATWRSATTKATHWRASSTTGTHAGTTTAVTGPHAFAAKEIETIVDVEHHVAIDAVILRVAALHSRDSA